MLAALILLIAFLVIIVLVVVMSAPHTRRRCANFGANPSPGLLLVIQKLVTQAAPRLNGKEYTKTDIEKIIGRHPDFDQVIYFHFRRLLSSDDLSIGSMLEAVGKSD